jgi:phage-related holin
MLNYKGMYFSDIINSVFHPTSLKIITSILVSLAFFFGGSYHDALIAIVMLIIFDTVLGVMATYYEGQAITSRRFSRVVQKGIVYFSSISAAYFTDSTIGWQVIQATMISFIAITEFISILENMGRMGFATPKKLLNQLQDFQSQK